MKPEYVIEALDSSSIYEVPISYHKQGLDEQICKHFNLDLSKKLNLSRWNKIKEIQRSSDGNINIGIVGKYTSLIDAYKSLIEAINHGGLDNNVKVTIKWVNSESLEDQNLNLTNFFKDINGIIVPGGFGERGSEGKINAIKYARLNNIPFFGICFGMQMAVIEFARNVLNMKDASSSEFGTTKFPLVGLLTEWQTKKGKEKRDILSEYGGTMRLGSYECHLKQN